VISGRGIKASLKIFKESPGKVDDQREPGKKFKL
jgi:hypothetical protein